MRQTGRIILFAAPLVVLTITGILLLVTLAPRLNARWTDDASISAPRLPAPRNVLWEPARPLVLPGESADDAYEPRVSPDGTMLVFVRRRAGTNADLFVSRVQAYARWSEPQPLAAINTPADELGPEFAPDAQSLYFYSDRPGGLGGYDIWVATRDGDSFTSPINLGPTINTPYNEYAPAWLPDSSCLYFASNRPKPGESRADSPAWPATLREQHARYDYDLYSAECHDRTFNPAGIVEALSTSADEGSPAVSPAGDFLYFASDRPGGLGGFDLYRARLRNTLPLVPENLGPAINSLRNELDPALAAHGFLLVFSSDRQRAGQLRSDSPDSVHDGSAYSDPVNLTPTYSLFHSISREVYLADDANASGRLLSRIWHDAWPWLALLSLLTALLWLLARLWTSELFRRRIAQLSLLAKCLLASAVIHSLLALLFAVWQVSQHVGDLFRPPGGSRVIVSSGDSPAALAAQIRAGLSIDDAATTSPSVPIVASPALDVHNATIVPATPDAVRLADHIPVRLNELHPSSRPAWRDSATEAPNIPPSATFAASIPTTPAPQTPAPEHSPAWQAVLPQTIAEVPVAIPAESAIPKDQIPSPLEQLSTRSSPTAARTVAVISSRLSASSPNVTASPLPNQPESQDRTILGIPTAAENHPATPEPTITAELAPPTPLAPPIAIPLTSSPTSDGHSTPSPGPLPIPPTSDTPTIAPLVSTSTTRSAGSFAPSPRLDLPSVGSSGATTDFSTRVPVLPAAAASPITQAEPSLDPSANTAPESTWLSSLGSSVPAPSPGSSSTATIPTPVEITAPKGAKAPSIQLQRARASAGTTDARAGSNVPLPPNDPPSSFVARLPELPAEPPPPLTPAETFTQRTPELRGEVLRQTGGTPESEQAVQRALAWLAKHQEADGHWGTRAFDGVCHCGGKGEVEADTAMTGLALLCFLGAGHTHQDPGPYTQTVAKALAWLTSRQSPSGDLRRGETMYGQTVACVALCEAFAMTQDQTLAIPTRRAFDFILAQSTRTASTRLDTSVLGWYVMAVESARRAGLAVPANALASTKSFLSSAASASSPGRYSSRKGESASPDMTAEAMFVQQLLGHARTEPAMDESARFILQTPPRWRDGAPTHYWYYATLALFQHQGDAWTKWNEAIVPELLGNQRTDANAAGSWDPQDEWSRTCGRVYQTAICTLSLEVYYRYKPAGMTTHQP